MEPIKGLTLTSALKPVPLERAPEKPFYTKHAPMASVLCVGIPGLGEAAYYVEPEKLLLWLHTLHSEIDKLTALHAVTKTDVSSGCCTTFVCGVESAEENPAAVLTTFAEALMRKLIHSKLPNGKLVRPQMGLHLGEVVAGVIGSQSLRYSVFGATVSIARQLEQCSGPGMIVLSDVAMSRIPPQQRPMAALGETVALPGAPPIRTYVVGSELGWTPELARSAGVAAREDRVKQKALLTFEDPRLEQPYKQVAGLKARRSDGIAYGLLLLCLAAMANFCGEQDGRGTARSSRSQGLSKFFGEPCLGIPGGILSAAALLDLCLPSEYLQYREVLVASHELVAAACLHRRTLLPLALLGRLHLQGLPLPEAVSSALLQGLALLCLSAALPLRLSVLAPVLAASLAILLPAAGEVSRPALAGRFALLLILGGLLPGLLQWARERAERSRFLRRVRG